MENKKEIYTIFGKYKIVKQAYIVFIVGTSISILELVLSIFIFEKPIFKLMGLFFSFMTLLITSYSTYMINCTIVGKCIALSWILVVANTIVLLSYIPQMISLASVLNTLSVNANKKPVKTIKYKK